MTKPVRSQRSRNSSRPTFPRKQFPAQMSLLTDSRLAELVDETNYQQPREHVAYVDNVGFSPKNFQEGTEAYEQWAFSPRKKNAKSIIERSMSA